MQHLTLRRPRLWRGLAALGAIGLACGGHAPAAELDRSPVDLVLSADETWLVAVNETAGTASLVDVEQGRVLDEAACGVKPGAVARLPSGFQVLVTAATSGSLTRFDVVDGKLVQSAVAHIGFEPVGIAVTADGRTAYVAQQAAATVAVVDLDRFETVDTIAVGRWPRYLALSPDGRRLAVGTSGDQTISVVDTELRELMFQEKFGGINVGHLCASADNNFVYFPWMIYRHNPITHRNIQAGWVLGSRIARVRLDEHARRQAMTLDPRGKAVSDPHGIALTSDESWLVATGAGTHELLAYRMEGLVFQDTGGPGDHIDPLLAQDDRRYFRIDLGGRPMGLRIAQDDRRAFVANYLSNAIQEVDLQSRRIARTISLGGPETPSLARQGEAIFYDGGRSLDQWYSCHSCHYEGGANAVAMDTMNDGTVRTFKTVLPLAQVSRTAPWTWHGWQTDLKAAMHKSLTETMLGPRPTDDDVAALVAYLDNLEPPPSPFLTDGGALSPAAERGREIFHSDKAGCARCHAGPYLTDGQIHDVGLGSERDVFEGFNTPTLRGLYRKVRYLHDGRAKSLQQVLTGPHNPDKVTGQGELTDSELADLIAFLQTL